MIRPRPQRVSKLKRLKPTCWISPTFSPRSNKQFYLLPHLHQLCTRVTPVSLLAWLWIYIGVTKDRNWCSWFFHICPALLLLWQVSISPVQVCSDMMCLLSGSSLLVSSLPLCSCKCYWVNFPLSWRSLIHINHCVIGWELFYLVNATISHHMKFNSFHTFTCVFFCK